MDGKKKLRAPLIASGVALTLVLLAGGGGAAYAVHYAEHALPGTTVSGQDVGGKTRDEIVALINDLGAQATVTTDVAGTSTTSTLADFGVTIDAEATADAVLAPNSSVVSRFQALVGSTQVPLVVDRDQSALEKTVKTLSSSAGPVVTDATITVKPDGSFAVTESVAGKSADISEVEAAVDKAVTTLSPVNATIQLTEKEPTVTTAQAKAFADKASAIVSQDVEISDGIDTFSPEPADKASWIALPAEGEKLGEPVVDKAKVSAWVEKLAESTNVAPQSGINNVDASGKVVAESRPGKKGMVVNNAPAVTAQVVASLAKGEAVNTSFNYDDVAQSFETRPVLPGSEKFPYRAHEGEKWIDVDLTKNTMTAYEGLKVVHGPIAMNHGKPGHETVTGVFHTYLQYEAQDMGCTPEWDYCAKDVPWVTYFEGSYALHGAPWVDEFGRGSVNGSHGCVNLPPGDAEWIFHWAGIGTAVTSHY